MRHTKKRKHTISLFANTEESVINEEQNKPKIKIHKKQQISDIKLFPKTKEWTRLDWLKHRQAVASTERLDYGMSPLLTKKAIQKPFIKAILEDKPHLPPKDAEYNWYYMLNFACAAGSEHSASYILDTLTHHDKKALRVILSDNTVLCYAASSGNMSLCQKLMNKPYNCKIDFDVMGYARLSGDLNFVQDFQKCFNNSEFKSAKINFLV